MKINLLAIALPFLWFCIMPGETGSVICKRKLYKNGYNYSNA